MTSLDWADAIPALLVSVVLLSVPGLLIGLAFGLRGTPLVGVAPPASFAAFGIATVLQTAMPVGWSILLVAAVTAVIVIAVLVARRLAGGRWKARPVREDWRYRSAFALALVVAAVLIGVRLATIFGGPGHISQTFDNVFHLNAVRWIIDTGDASPLHIGSLTWDLDHRTAYYPGLWHAFVAVVVQLSGASIPVAVNAANIAIAALAWPLGCLLLARAVFGTRGFPAIMTGVLAAAFGAFPYLMIEFGVLYPNLLSIALLPGVLAIVVFAAGLGTASPVSPLAAWLLVLGTGTGLVLAHPSTFIALIGFSVPIAGVALYRAARALRAEGAPRRRVVRLWLLAAAGFAAGAAAFVVVRPVPAAAFWGPWTSPFTGLWTAIAGAPMSMPVDIVVAVLSIVGVVAIVLTRRSLWLLGSFGIGIVLYAIAVGAPQGLFRYLMVGTWYSDTNRLAALLPVVALPVAVSGAAWLVELVGVLARRVSSAGARRAIMLAVAAVLAVLAVAVTQTGGQLAQRTVAGSALYRLTPDSPLLSSDEAQLLERVPEHVPEGVVVAGSPWTGASLVYAIADRRALLPAIFGDRDADTRLLMDGLRDAATDAEVCAALERTGVGFVLDFGANGVHPGPHPFPGFEELDSSDAVEPVDEQGPARLFEVTGCR